MAIDVKTEGSDGWWLKTLLSALTARREGRGWSPTGQNPAGVRPPLTLLQAYLDGEPPLPQSADGWREQTRELMRMSRMNYAELVVGSVSDRLVPAGWTTAADQDADGDAIAQRIARANRFGTLIPEAATRMLALADAYFLVGAPDPVSGIPVVTVEDPCWTITAEDGGGRPIAGLKAATDRWTGVTRLFLYRPGRVAVARYAGNLRGETALAALSPTHWEWDDEASGDLPGLEGRMPLVRVQNRGGLGEFEPHLDVLDRINDGILSRVTTAKIQAFRQRAIEDLPDTDAEGKPIDYTDMFIADPGALWRLPSGASIWESGVVDLGPIRLAIKDDVEALAAVTRTPLHYVTPDAASGSAEGASTMKEGMVFRVEDRRRRLEDALAEVMSLALTIMGEADRADPTAIRTIWLPAERYTLSEKANAEAQTASSLPFRMRMGEVWQKAPSEIAGLEAERAAEALYSDAAPTPGV